MNNRLQTRKWKRANEVNTIFFSTVAVVFAVSAFTQPVVTINPALFAIRQARPVSINTVLSSSRYSPGEYRGSPMSGVGRGDRITSVFDTTEHLDPAQCVTIFLESSVDGKTHWQLHGAARRCGGLNLNRKGEHISAAGFEIAIDYPGWIFRGGLNIEGGEPLRTSSTILWTAK
jgi:hypothetical protein